MAPVSERRRYVCNIFFHWLRRCSSIQWPLSFHAYWYPVKPVYEIMCNICCISHYLLTYLLTFYVDTCSCVNTTRHPHECWRSKHDSGHYGVSLHGFLMHIHSNIQYSSNIQFVKASGFLKEDIHHISKSAGLLTVARCCKNIQTIRAVCGTRVQIRPTQTVRRFSHHIGLLPDT